MMYLAFGLIIGLPAFAWYINKYESFQEQQLQLKNRQLTRAWNTVNSEIKLLDSTLCKLIKKDDQYYRTLLDMEPLSSSIRDAGVGGISRNNYNGAEYEIITSNFNHLEKVKSQLEVATQSYQALTEAAEIKSILLASRPAIQPIHNKQLRTLHLTFGRRMHPIFNVYTDHKGLDFSASFGTPVYATGDGRVSMTYYSNSYGNVIYIDHGFNFETRYAHLRGFNVQPGNYVKRGDLIGYVGNTGISAAPHLHYEVFYKGNAVNPINFFQRDFSTAEYQKIISAESQTGTSAEH